MISEFVIFANSLRRTFFITLPKVWLSILTLGKNYYIRLKRPVPEISEKTVLYIIKTQYIHSRIKSMRTCPSLFRPRRFGKSLFLDTLAEYFSSNRFLFKGLAINKSQPEEWTSYPVIRLNMNKSSSQNPNDLTNLILSQQFWWEKYKLSIGLIGSPKRYPYHKVYNNRICFLIL